MTNVGAIGPDDPHDCRSWARWKSDGKYYCQVCSARTCPYFNWRECYDDFCPVHDTGFRQAMGQLADFMLFVELESGAQFGMGAPKPSSQTYQVPVAGKLTAFSARVVAVGMAAAEGFLDVTWKQR